MSNVGFFPLLLLLILSSNIGVNAQVRVEFSPRTSIFSPNRTIYSVNGDFTFIGNTNMTREDYSEDAMNDGMMIFIDVDDDPETINSSSATLEFSKENGANKACTDILFAGLYWTGRGPANMEFNVTRDGQQFLLNKRKVKFKGPGQGSYVEIEANEDEIRYPPNLNVDLGMFVGFAEVTQYVRQWGEGKYDVADIALLEGTNWHYGGWGLVVVYENFLMERRDITVFDGYAFVRGQGFQSFTIPVSGFSAVEEGDVNVKLGLMAGEGDVGADGDYFAIERGLNTNDFVRLSHELNTENNFFNSSIITGNNERNPNLRNNTGMDIAVFDIPNDDNNLIGNNQTETRFNYGSTWDVYAIFNITLAVNANIVEIEPFNKFKKVNGVGFDEGDPTVLPGEIVEFELSIRNKGGISVHDGIIEIPVPSGLEFVDANGEFFFETDSPGNIYLEHKEDENDVLVWEVGDIPIPENKDELLATLRYEFRVSTNCEFLAKICQQTFEINGSLSGMNGLTNTPLDPKPFISAFSELNRCQHQPIFDALAFRIDAMEFLQSECGWENEKEFEVCVGENGLVDFQTIANEFPDWMNFFLETNEGYKLMEEGEPFVVSDEASYHAGVQEGEGCFMRISIIENKLTLFEEIISLASCERDEENIIGVTVQGGMEPYAYEWDDPNNSRESVLEGILPGVYSVKVIDAIGCESAITVEVPEFIHLNISLNALESHQDLGCSELPDGKLVLEIEGGNYPMVLTIQGKQKGEKVFSEEMLLVSPEDDLIIDGLPSGDYSLVLTDNYGCTSTKDTAINYTEDSGIEVSFSVESNSLSESGYYFKGAELSFTGVSNTENNLIYEWDFGDGITSTSMRPVHTYSSEGDYLIRLTAKDEYGCESGYEKVINVRGFFFRMPNAFNPVGNENDHFFPVFSGLQSIRFWVYNRWGELLFFTDNLESKGWDGKLGGKEMPIGTYVYQVFYSGKRGEEEKKTGSFQLFR